MCFKRPDGYYIKDINPYTKIMPHIMPHRYDAMNSTKVEVICEPIDEFIASQAQLGNKYTYTEILIASMVRLMGLRPAINRFVKGGRIYQHNDVTVSFVVKKSLKDECEDTTVKLHFTGAESLPEISAKIKEVVEKNTGTEAYNSVDKTAKILTNIPHWLIEFALRLFDWLDNRNLLPKKIIEISPMHNSFFITLMKSINGDYVYHHCYEFGTTGIFAGVGKEKPTPIVEKGEIVIRRLLTIGMVTDERFCDGFYFAKSARLLKDILKKPETLLERIDLSTVENKAGTRDAEAKAHYKELAKKHEEDKKQAKKEMKMAKAQEKEAQKQAKKQNKNSK